MTSGSDFAATAARLARLYDQSRDLAAGQLKNSTDFIASEGPVPFVPLHRVILGLRGQDMLARSRSGQELARHHPVLLAAGYVPLRHGADGFNQAWDSYVTALSGLGVSGPSKGTPSAQAMRVFYVPGRSDSQRDAVLRAMDRVQSEGIPAGFGRAKVWFVQHPTTGQFLPVKPVWGLEAGKVGADFISHHARDKLRALGFLVPGPDDRAADLALTPSELVQRSPFTEGAVRQITTNRRERSPKARSEAETHYRALNGGRLCCQGCGIDFGLTYGPRGDGFMHFHHKAPLAKAKEERPVSGAEDLVPLCPNCHAMVHRGEVLWSVSDLQAQLGHSRRQRRKAIRQPRLTPPAHPARRDG